MRAQPVAAPRASPCRGRQARRGGRLGAAPHVRRRGRRVRGRPEACGARRPRPLRCPRARGTRPRHLPARAALERGQGARPGAGVRGHAPRRPRQGPGRALRVGARRLHPARGAARHGAKSSGGARPLSVLGEGLAARRERGDGPLPARRSRGARTGRTAHGRAAARAPVGARGRDARRGCRGARDGRGAFVRPRPVDRARIHQAPARQTRDDRVGPGRRADHRGAGQRPAVHAVSLEIPVAANRLARETSPYLLQHAHNPVDWYPWGEEAFARARAEDKPILLSVGYSACHWCHVMERESFEDPEIAALMNRHFVSVTVDREGRPDVDQIYMQAVQSMTGHGGWPMTCFLTPDARPFYGGTYFPPVDRHGLPGFPRLLQALADAWATRRGEVLSSASQIGEALGQTERLRGAAQLLTADVLSRGFQQLSEQFDDANGGLGGAPKFPQPLIWDFVLRFWKRSKNPRARQMAHTTLTMMARGGMYDQVGGGFHRYSVDGQWLVPHFEKMLYDNAQLASLYLHAWLAFGDPDCRRVAEETLDYILREMTDPAGGFYSAQDADSDGHEGKFFVWTGEELRDILGET